MNIYWKTCCCYITPILLSFLVIVKFVQHQPLKSVAYKYCDEEISYEWPNGWPISKNITPIDCQFINTTDKKWNATFEKETYYDPNRSTLDIQSLGLLISFSSVLLIPLVGMYQLFKRTKKGKPTGMAMFRKTHNWKPAITASPSVINLTEEDPKSDFKRKSSKRGSRKSFRRHLPPNAELLE